MNIKFKYQHIYEQRLNPKAAILSSEKIEEGVALMDVFWKERGASVEMAMKEVTGLNFKQSSIVCYLNSTMSFSDPLTLAIEDAADMYDNLVHELIHIILMDNEEALLGWQAMFERYKTEPRITKTHIGIHAIHELVALKIFPHRMERIKSYSKNPEYVRSWEIVNKDGAENIIAFILSPHDRCEYNK